MEAFACGVAAVSLGRNCLSSLKALHTLWEKYRNARTTIAALHSEITVIAASMQYINVIFEQHTDLAKKRFYENPELEQTFEAAIAGCNLILSCLDERVESISAELGPETSKGRKGKAQWLWREEALKELLSTLRGQHSAIFSIIQCFQVQNIADLGTRIDQLREIVSGNQYGVEEAVKRPPLLSHPQLESPYHVNSVSSDEPRLVGTPSQSGSAGYSTSSRDRIQKSYQHYRTTISGISIRHPSRSTCERQPTAYSYEDSNDDGASIRGLAPSTILASDPSKNDDAGSDRRSVMSAISTSSWTQKWLESQLSPEATIKALRRVESTLSMAPTISDVENSIVASDVQTFLENIRSFMPILDDTDTNDRETSSQSISREHASVDLEDDMLMEQHPPIPDSMTLDEVSRDVAHDVRDPVDWLRPTPTRSHQTGSKSRTSTMSKQSDDMESDESLTTSSHKQRSDPNTPSETDRTSTISFEQVDFLQLDKEEEKLAHLAKPMADVTPATAPSSSTRLSIYSEKHPHQRGTVICTPPGNNPRQIRPSFSQALAESTPVPLPDVYHIGARVFFVQKAEKLREPMFASQEPGLESDSETTNMMRKTAAGTGHSLPIFGA